MPKSFRIDQEATKANQGWTRPVADTMLFLAIAVVCVLPFLNRVLYIPAFSPSQQFGLRALAVLWPTIGALLAFSRPIRYQVEPGETVISRRLLFKAITYGGWTLALMLPGPIVVALALGEWVVQGSPGGERLSTIGFSAIYSLAAAVFFSSMVFYESELRADAEGLRLGTNHFLEWGKVSRVEKAGDKYRVFHPEIKSVPVTTILPQSREAESALLSWFGKRGITVQYESGSAFILPWAAWGTAVVLLAVGVFAWVILPVDGRWVGFFTTVVCILVQLVFEKWRGLSKLTKVVPPVDRNSFQEGMGQPAIKQVQSDVPRAPIAEPDPSPWSNPLDSNKK